MELLFYVDALKRASARSVTAVIPYFSYAKGDKKDEPRVSIRARVCADALEAAGVDRVITVDLHAAQIQGFFSVPVDNLTAMPSLVEAVRGEALKDVVIVAADAGFAKTARTFAARYGAPVAIADKRRVAHDDHAEVMGVLGDVAGKTAVIVDDFSISCQTLAENAAELRRMGATKVLAAITHGVFASGSMQIIADSCIEKLFVTDTIETQPEPIGAKIKVVPIAWLIAEAIRRIHRGESVSQLFD
jgi:ribose-phosphate pyrophosphokinase